MSNISSDHYFLRGGGEMGKLIRAKDWSKTPLGDLEDWPESLRTMVAMMLENPFGMYIAWGSEYIQLYNDWYRPILGSSKHPQALGISTRETFSEIWHIIESMFDDVMNGKAVGFPDFMLPLHRNGFVEECYFDFSYSPIIKNDGEVGGVLVTVIETTNKKRAEEAFKESEQRFRDTVKQPPAGKMTFEKQPFEIRPLITSILYSFDLKIKENNIALIKEYDPKIPSMLLGDSLRLNQVILNLMGNAVKFTHKGKIILSVRLLHEDEENVNIEFSVTDSGIGIAGDKINTIFNLFEQAELSTSSSYDGTGLRLPIVKQLIEAQGGSISLESKLGEGSTFSFILPFVKINIKLAEEIEILKLDSEFKKLRILVAEDVVLNQLQIKIILSDFGFEYEIVDNGKLAIEKMQTNTYDIILMDLRMPEMNGFEVTEYIRKTLKSRIPIIALTAAITTADVSKCKKIGVDDYITKPIKENLLYSKIMELVKRHNNS